MLAETVYEWSRVPAGSGPASITAATRSSIQGGVEAAGVAADAFASVAEEAGRLLDDRQAAVVLGRYVERLLRSDLGRHVSAALARHDPAIGELFRAIRDFVVALPPRYLAMSDALTMDILEPPLRSWRRLDPGGWDALLELAETAIRLDPTAIRRRSALARMGLRVGLAGRGLPRRVLAATLLTLRRLPGGVRRRVRRWLGR